MSKHNKQLQSGLARIAGPTSAFSAMVFALSISRFECPLQQCLSMVVSLTWGALPSMVLSGWRVLQAAHACDASPLAEGVLRISESCWQVIACVMAGL